MLPEFSAVHSLLRRVAHDPLRGELVAIGLGERGASAYLRDGPSSEAVLREPLPPGCDLETLALSLLQGASPCIERADGAIRVEYERAADCHALMRQLYHVSEDLGGPARGLG